MTLFYVVPIGAIFLILVVLMIWRRQRQRDRTVFVPPRNYVMPMQPANFNSVNSHYGTPMSNAPPTPLQYPHHVANPMPTPQYFPPTPQHLSPSPQPLFTPHTSPITIPPTTQPNPATSSDGSDLNRMLEVQTLMVEIHRLEGESREGNQQRIQELKQRVGELSGTDGRMPVPDSFLQPPPAYDVKQSIGRPEYGAAGRG